MARKVVNRKELRAEAEAAERLEEEEELDEDDDQEDEDEEAPKKKPVKKAAAKPKTRTKTAKEVRLKAFWGVFNQSMKRVALYEYADRKSADKKAAELSTNQKTPHFVQPVKEAIS